MMDDKLYDTFARIEERGLQFLLPKEWKVVYNDYLREKKFRKLIANIEESIANLDTLDFDN